jgi:Na+/H+-dicarboxylate symporter
MARSDSRLGNRILLGLAIGAAAAVLTLILGNTFPSLLKGGRWLAAYLFDPLGQIFLRLLFFVVIPLIFTSLASGILQLGDISRLGPLATRTFALFFLNMSIAVALGLVMMNIVQPGERLDEATQARLMAEFGGKGVPEPTHAAELTPATLVDMFMPRNLIGAFVGNQRNALGEILPLILFAILVGAAGVGLSEARRAKLQAGLDTVAELMTSIVHLALRLAPYGRRRQASSCRWVPR